MTGPTTQGQGQAAPVNGRFVQANVLVEARTLSAQERVQYNIPANAAPDVIGIFNPTTGELINTMGADQFGRHYHSLESMADRARQSATSQPAPQGESAPPRSNDPNDQPSSSAVGAPGQPLTDQQISAANAHANQGGGGQAPSHQG